MTPEHRVRRLLELLCVDPDRVAPDLAQALIEVAREQRGRSWVAESFIEAMRSIPQLWLPGRFHEIVDSVTAPTLLIHGAGDPVVSVAGSEHLARRRPDWTFFALPGVGHTPQLEAPEQFLRLVSGWLDAR
jgi:pimeloyl-ACP methyl ester carboxylesterase